MLKRVAAHWLVIGGEKALPCAGVAVDSAGVVTEIFSLDDARFEPAETTFVDGFVAPFLADVSAVEPDGLKVFLLTCAAKFDASIRVGSPAQLFNYFISEGGQVVATSLDGLLMNK